MATEHRIFLLRHGETEHNRIGRFQGQGDSPLTEKGIAQARRNGRVLAGLLERPRRWRVISSPLGRTLHTAKLVCFELGLDAGVVETDARLQEIGFGKWEGSTIAEIEAREPGIWARRRKNRWSYVIEGGESYAMVAERVAAWFTDLDGEAIVVSHGACGRVLRGLYLGLTPQQTLALDEPQDVVFELRGGEILRH